MPHFPKHYDVGSHCHLALWLTKFESERPGADPVVDSWTLRMLFTRPLLGQSPDEGVISMLKRRIVEAAQAEKDPITHTKYIDPAKAQAVVTAIQNYENLNSVDCDKSFSYFFLHTPGQPESDLFAALSQQGLYIPPVEKSTESGDQPEISALLMGNTSEHPPRPKMWDRRLPDPHGGVTTLGELTYEELYTSTAKRIAHSHMDAYQDLASARRTGVLRAYGPIISTACPPPHLPPDTILKADVVLMGYNGKCCAPNVGCMPTSANKYCEEVSAKLCNAMSDPC